MAQDENGGVHTRNEREIDEGLSEDDDNGSDTWKEGGREKGSRRREEEERGRSSEKLQVNTSQRFSKQTNSQLLECNISNC